jgi:hypothetical protein
MSNKQVSIDTVKAAFSGVADIAIALFNLDGELHIPLGFVFTEASPGVLKYEHKLCDDIMLDMFSSAQHKVAAMAMITALLSGDVDAPFDSDLIVLATEAWTKELTDPKEIAEVDRLGKTAADFDDRGETVIVFVYTKGHSYIGRCPISTVDGKKVCVMGELALECHTQGRMIQGSNEEATH